MTRNNSTPRFDKSTSNGKELRNLAQKLLFVDLSGLLYLFIYLFFECVCRPSSASARKPVFGATRPIYLLAIATSVSTTSMIRSQTGFFSTIGVCSWSFLSRQLGIEFVNRIWCMDMCTKRRQSVSRKK